MSLPPIFSNEEYTGLVVDNLRSHTSNELKLDLIEDVYELEFKKNSMVCLFTLLSLSCRPLKFRWEGRRIQLFCCFRVNRDYALFGIKDDTQGKIVFPRV
jgi:hypothetical protein